MQTLEHRHQIFGNFLKLSFECAHHPGEQANMIVTKEEVEPRGLICALCLPTTKLQGKQQMEPKALKMMLLQIHQTCGTLLSDVTTAAFVDHHINLIRMIAKNHFKEFEANLQNAISVYFQKTRELLNGKYFIDFYTPIANVVALRTKGPSQDKRQLSLWMNKVLSFIYQFDRLANEYEEYANIPLQQKLEGVNMVKYIKSEVGSIYKQFKEKVQGSKKTLHQQQILQMFNPFESAVKSFKFSQTFLHPDLKITDSKNMKMPNLPDNQYTLLALIEPSIGNKKRTIKLRMDGIKGWMAAGLAYKSAADSFGYKFQQPTHGTVQMSYDGYSWCNDSAVNEVYTSWYYNQGDILTITANPSTGELIFMRNEDPNTHTLKFTKEKKDKLYFCVSVNYHGDEVTIVD